MQIENNVIKSKYPSLACTDFVNTLFFHNRFLRIYFAEKIKYYETKGKIGRRKG